MIRNQRKRLRGRNEVNAAVLKQFGNSNVSSRPSAAVAAAFEMSASAATIGDDLQLVLAAKLETGSPATHSGSVFEPYALSMV
jgi:hypothetical protein